VLYKQQQHYSKYANCKPLGCIHIDTSTGYGYVSAGCSKHEFACIPMAAFTLIQVRFSTPTGRFARVLFLGNPHVMLLIYAAHSEDMT